MITAQSRGLIRLHVHYKNKILAFKGGLLDQPNFYLDAMELLEQL